MKIAIDYIVTKNYSLTPSIIGFIVTGSILVYFFYKKSSLGIIISSLIFITSGFIFQFIVNNNILNIPLFGTIFAIFVANSLLKFFGDNKKKEQIATLFINSIDSQVRSLGFIDKYLIESYIEETVQHIEIYKNRLKENNYYQTAFKEIGIYDKNIIDLISKYSIRLEEFFSYLDRYLLQVNLEKDRKNSNWNNKQLFIIVKLELITTLLFGFLCIYALEVKYTQRDKYNITFKVYNDFYTMMDLLENKYFILTRYSKLNKNLGNDLIEKLMYLKKIFEKLNTSIFNNKIAQLENKPLFIGKISLKETSHDICDFKRMPKTSLNIDYLMIFIFLTVFGFFQFAFAIIKTINEIEYKYMSTPYFTKEECLIAIGKSQEEVENKCNAFLKDILKEQYNDELFKNNPFEIKIENISLE